MCIPKARNVTPKAASVKLRQAQEELATLAEQNSRLERANARMVAQLNEQKHCSICYGDRNKTHAWKTCGHVYCLQCVQSALAVAAKQGRDGVECYISWCGGVRFAANEVSAVGISRRQVNIFWDGEDLPYETHDIFALSQKFQNWPPEGCRPARFLRPWGFSISSVKCPC
jgi:hypothetical protein